VHTQVCKEDPRVPLTHHGGSHAQWVARPQAEQRVAPERLLGVSLPLAGAVAQLRVYV